MLAVSGSLTSLFGALNLCAFRRQPAGLLQSVPARCPLQGIADHQVCHMTWRDIMIKDGVLYRQPSGSAVSKNKDGLVRWLSGLADADEVGLILWWSSSNGTL